MWHSLLILRELSDDSCAGKGAFFYDPSIPAAVIFAILFAVATLAHVYLAFKFKTLFMTALLVGVGMEFVGFVTRWVRIPIRLPQSGPDMVSTLRVISIKSPDSLPPNIISQVALIVAPAFLAAQGKKGVAEDVPRSRH